MPNSSKHQAKIVTKAALDMLKEKDTVLKALIVKNTKKAIHEFPKPVYDSGLLESATDSESKINAESYILSVITRKLSYENGADTVLTGTLAITARGTHKNYGIRNYLREGALKTIKEIENGNIV